jgi:hypothetical protein
MRALGEAHSRIGRPEHIQSTKTSWQRMTRSRQTDDALFNLSCAFSLAQLPIMLAIISYYPDPLFAMYTTNLLNITTKEMDIEVEDFSASILYTIASTSAALFALASKQAILNPDSPYTMEALEELRMWDLVFWLAMILQHTCIVTFMCSPLDWYFLSLVVTGITLLLLLISRLPLVEGGRSRENILMLLCGALFFMLYTTVRRHGHGGFFMGLLILDALILIGHTFDSSPDMRTVGNCRLCYTSGMSILLLVSFIHD